MTLTARELDALANEIEGEITQTAWLFWPSDKRLDALRRYYFVIDAIRLHDEFCLRLPPRREE